MSTDISLYTGGNKKGLLPEEDDVLRRYFTGELFVALKRVAGDFGLRFVMDS